MNCSLLITSKNAFWETVLNSIGISWKSTNGRIVNTTESRVTVITKGSLNNIREYVGETLSRGGVLVLEDSYNFLDDVIPSEILNFHYDKRYFLDFRKKDKTKMVQVEIKRNMNGAAIFLPFELKEVLDNQVLNKRYISIKENRRRTIWENLPTVNKKNVRRVVYEVLKIAFHLAGLPMVHKWYWPRGSRSIFCLRGDMDAGHVETMSRFLNVVEPWKQSLTLFVCGSSYRGKINLLKLAAKTASEIGNHTYTHYVYSRKNENRDNLGLTERLLAEAGIAPKGYVGPASFWNASMYDVLQERGYQYTSSFGIDHDNFPYFPVRDSERMYDLVEIPFHCLGDRFPKFGLKLDSPEVSEFFERLIEKKYEAGEAIALYGHPDMTDRMGDYPELVKRICQKATSMPSIWTGNLSELAKWWRIRQSVKTEISFEPTTGFLSAKYGKGEPDIFWSIETEDGRWFLEKSSRIEEGVKLDALTPRTPLTPVRPNDVGELLFTPPNRSLLSTYRTWRTDFKRKIYKKRELKIALEMVK